MIAATPPVWVAPSGSSVPEHLLRFSIRFARPQPLGLPAPVTLGRDGEDAIAGALLPDVLWSPDRRTATVLLTPGRVKSGLLARTREGPVLAPGDRIEVRLGRTVARRWRVTPGGCAPPDPAAWRIDPPPTGTRRPLLVRFAGPIDALSKDRLALVRAGDARRVAGRSRLTDGETAWRFRPARPWRSGAVRLVVADDLETPCGDRPGRPFEQAATAGDAPAPSPASTRVILIEAKPGSR